MSSVLLIDDHPIVLQGCRTVLEEAGFTEIHEASDLASAYRLYHRKHPRIIVLDLSIHGKGLAGLTLISRIRARDRRTPILVFSMHSDAVVIRRALDAGATGYLLKDTAAEEFIDAVNAVRRGLPFLSHRVALQVAMLGESGSKERMTQRELQTLALVADGKAYAQIAEELGVSYKTVANTCSQLKLKLGAGTLPELIRMSIEYVASAPAKAPMLP
ncbi:MULTISPECIES: response regulator transcription factor [Rhodomicrobium]|uniref:response regulator transcription factor n=1 Tax=Rhodomicrobium TaxID=1068 RepID=UPI000B4B2EF6|nr:MULTISPECIES: response regulator transcription factor [Rhodomicrobium]